MWILGVWSVLECVRIVGVGGSGFLHNQVYPPPTPWAPSGIRLPVVALPSWGRAQSRRHMTPPPVPASCGLPASGQASMRPGLWPRPMRPGHCSSPLWSGGLWTSPWVWALWLTPSLTHLGGEAVFAGPRGPYGRSPSSHKVTPQPPRAPESYPAVHCPSLLRASSPRRFIPISQVKTTNRTHVREKASMGLARRAYRMYVRVALHGFRLCLVGVFYGFHSQSVSVCRRSASSIRPRFHQSVKHSTGRTAVRKFR